MYDLLATLVRYGLMILAGHLATKGYFDAGLVDYIASFGVAALAFGWFLWTKKKPVPDDDFTGEQL